MKVENTIRNLVYALISSVFMVACNDQAPSKGIQKETAYQAVVNRNSELPFDSTELKQFFLEHPSLKEFKQPVESLYMKNGYHYIWYDRAGLIEYAHILFNQSNQLEDEGIHAVFPEKALVEALFQDTLGKKHTEIESEMLLSSLYVFYVNKVYKGVDEQVTTAIGWLLPRKKIAYSSLLDSILAKKRGYGKNKDDLFFQYNLLHAYLKKYRDIERNNTWKKISIPSGFRVLKPGDTAQIIREIKEKLYILGDLKTFNQSYVFDKGLEQAMELFNYRNGLKNDSLIRKTQLIRLNTPIHEMIKQIVVNMERCRWIDPEMIRVNEFIVVNIPDFSLNFYRNGKHELWSPVVVGNTINKTVIFSGQMKHIVFSPYWNVPKSILNKEIIPGIAKNRNYLTMKNMEWYKGGVRQKPGKDNALGQVKFLFPNEYNIYLHDTPSKDLFEKESRAFSHGCIRVGNPKELAIAILKDDSNWTPEKIDQAMNSGKESWYKLKQKLVVYIGYFTCWVDNQGNLRMLNDIYNRDERLFTLLMN